METNDEVVVKGLRSCYVVIAGMCTIPLASLPVGDTVDQWFDLEKSYGEEELGPVRSKHHGPDILNETW